jgi:altronate hydrolase
MADLAPGPERLCSQIIQKRQALIPRGKSCGYNEGQSKHAGHFMAELKLFQRKTIQITPSDTVAVALVELRENDQVNVGGRTIPIGMKIPAKHKFTLKDFKENEKIVMYGVVVGEATEAIGLGHLLTTSNTKHRSSDFAGKTKNYHWDAPDVSAWGDRTFSGYHRSDGQVGTRNFWLVVPLVFCENRNIRALEQAFQKELGNSGPQSYARSVSDLVNLYRAGKIEDIKKYRVEETHTPNLTAPIFPNIDGVRFLTHEMGCGGTRDDAQTLCGLIAGYIHHPNVAGATILSLGCQNAQISLLQDAIHRRNPRFDKPLLIFDQQERSLESTMLSDAITQTFLGLVQANEQRRTPAPLAKLTIGLKCGGSDGFSGISANPSIGRVADLISVLGGKTILAEFPELCGLEQSLINRCTTQEAADRFATLMRTYAARAKDAGSGFDMNPSPGNIADGLITDAMKSAGAARKGGDSLITAVLDYPEYAVTPGLNLLCTPGNDVEAVTAQVGAGANVVLFTTGLGTPTGNPIAPVIKVATNSELAARMHDIIDIDTGAVIRGETTINDMGDSILEKVISIASGETATKAELKVQEDFIPWKRGVSL